MVSVLQQHMMDWGSHPANPATFFHLVPTTIQSGHCFADLRNSRFVSMTGPDGEIGLEVGFHVAVRPRKSTHNITTLGSDGDLRLYGDSIETSHVAFDIHPITRAILLRVEAGDTRSVQVRPRPIRVDGLFNHTVLIPGNDYHITIGAGPDPYEFDVRWNEALCIPCAIDAHLTMLGVPRAPRQFPFLAEPDISAFYKNRPGGLVYEVHILEKMRVMATSGEMYRAIDVDSGHFVAVRVVRERVRNYKTVEQFNQGIDLWKSIRHVRESSLS